MFGPFSLKLAQIPAPPRCWACGAAPGADHTKGCQHLRELRAARFPEVLEENGRPWYLNRIDILEQEIAQLKARNGTPHERDLEGGL